jgi:hypothetical protein
MLGIFREGRGYFFFAGFAIGVDLRAADAGMTATAVAGGSETRSSRVKTV